MLVKPHRIAKVNKHLLKEDITILDVGAGSHSASITKEWLPNCIYHGVDVSRNYYNDERDFSMMDSFYEMDLTKLDFGIIPNNFFDLIIMSHIIEHLPNGDQVIEKLIPKLKSNGIIYIEYPSFKSTKLPSMKETLNFFDDPTHCRIYSLPEIYNIMMKNNLVILEGGKRRQWINIFLVPFKSILQLFTKGYIRGGVMWDITGFAEYVIAKENK
jgi:ubiquinone/menaquinone biosynthesis C-methylase UbiE